MVVDRAWDPAPRTGHTWSSRRTGAGFDRTGRLATSTKGYGATRFDLSDFAGHSIRIGFRVTRPDSRPTSSTGTWTTCTSTSARRTSGRCATCTARSNRGPDRSATSSGRRRSTRDRRRTTTTTSRCGPRWPVHRSPCPWARRPSTSTGLDPDTTYTVAVRAVNTSDNQPGVGRVITLRTQPVDRLHPGRGRPDDRTGAAPLHTDPADLGYAGQRQRASSTRAATMAVNPIARFQYCSRARNRNDSPRSKNWPVR